MREREGRRLRDMAMFEEIEKVVLLEKCKQLLHRNHQLEELVEKLADDNALLRKHGASLTEHAKGSRLGGVSYGKEAAFKNIGKDTENMLNNYYKDEQTDASLRAQLADQKDKIEELLRENSKLEQDKKALYSQVEFNKNVLMPVATLQPLPREVITQESINIETLQKESEDYQKRPLELTVSKVPLGVEAKNSKNAINQKIGKSMDPRAMASIGSNTLPKNNYNYSYSQINNDGNKVTNQTVEKKIMTSSGISHSGFIAKSIMDDNMKW